MLLQRRAGFERGVNMPNYGELAIIMTPRGKRRLMRLEEGRDLHTGEGVLRMADVARADFGAEVATSLGVPCRIQRPTIYDLIRGVKRQTQIMYPKDICYICMRLGVGPGRTVIEAGSGSGGLTVGLSWFSGPTGHVHSFEAREEFHKLARRNLEWAGLGQNVTLRHHDIAEGFSGVTGADALFLDVRTPWDYLCHIPAAVKPGASLAFFLPTMDQVGALLLGLEQGPFDDTDVCELLLRRWKPTPDRLRPEDRMIAHTGFLIFARHQERSEAWEALRPLGTRERKQEAARRLRLGLDGAAADADSGSSAP
jgi:tRNA (adenine57-N1/adenine58-N1)-methyltransferase